MKRRIHIRLVQESHGWKNILDQTGASWSIGLPANLSASDASCIILNREPVNEEMTLIQSFIKDGGVVIDTTGILFQEKPKTARITELKPYLDSESDFNTAGTIFLQNPSYSLSDSTYLGGLIVLKPGKRIAFWGIDIDQFYEGFEKSLRTFTHTTLPTISERAARCNSGEVLRVFLLLLIRLHQEAELPFIRKWPNQKNEKLPATFRVDHDFGKDNSVIPLAKLLKKEQVPATWFLHTDALTMGAKEALTADTGFEPALHCHRHIEFKKAKAIKNDIRDGLDQLKNIDITPLGYAAPYGNWSLPLQQAIESYNFSYSSEFCYDFDSLPSFPSGSNTLQVPVHPVSIGTLKRFEYNGEMMTRYFQEIVQLKKLRFEPIHLYHHPNDRHEEVLNRLFGHLKGENYQFMSYSEFAESWKQINNREAHFFFDGKSIEMNYPFTAAVHKGDSMAITVDKQISLNELNFVSFADQDIAEWVRKREENQTLSKFEQLKYGFLAWRWRNKA